MSPQTVQELINKRAEQRLDKDLGKFSQFRYNRFFDGTNNEASVSRPTIDGLNAYAFFAFNSKFMREPKAYWLPNYIAVETQNFFNSVYENNEAIVIKIEDNKPDLPF